MGLKEIIITGFKSFSKRTVISFCEGINAIVGPNGCGKSNIVDAFLWALGQQSAKSLRASSMQDVIFAGSQKQKSQSFAEVTVVLSNEHGLLPIEYQEVAITRRLYRDGESEYLLNKQHVRLKDIVELLAHTGVGKEAFAVIGQGKVAEIISHSPQERRSLFEEVAGISHFLLKRKESERKLELAKISRARAEDIVREVEAQKKVLEKQASDARRYQEMRKRLFCLERLLCQTRFCELKAACVSMSDVLARSEEALDKSEKQESALKEAYSQKKEALRLAKEAHDQGTEMLHEVQSALQAYKKDLGFCEEKKGSLLSQEAESRKEIKTFQEAIDSLTHQKQEVEAEVAKSFAARKLLEQENDEAHETWQTSHQEKEDLENSVKALYSTRFSLQSRLQSLEADLKKCQLAREVALEKIQERTTQNDRIDTQRQQALMEQTQKKEELFGLVAQVDEKKRLVENFLGQIKAIACQIEERKNLRNALQQELFERNARHKALSQLANNMEGFTTGAKALLQEAKKAASPLYGKVQALAELTTLEHDLLMRLYDASLVVATIKDLELALQVAEKLKSQEVTFICLELLGVKSVERLNAYFVKAIKESQNFEANAWVQEKYYVDAYGVLHLKGVKKENLFQRSQTINQLAKQIEELQAQLLEHDGVLKTQDEKRLELTQEMQKQDQEMRRIDMQVVACNFQLQGLEKKLLELTRDLERMMGEMASLNELVETLKGQFDSKERELQQAKEALAAVESEFQESDAKVQTLRKTNAELSEAREQANLAIEAARKRHEKEQHGLELIQVRLKEQTIRLDQELKLQKTLQAELATIDKRQKELEKELGTSQEQLLEKEALKSKKDQETKACEAEVRALELAIEQEQLQKEERIKESSTQKATLQHLKEQMEIFGASLQEEPPEGYDTFQEPVPTEEELQRLKNSVDRHRHVNLLAVEEHEAACGRHKLLVEQLEDLRQAELELLQIVTDLERESQKAFSKTFEEVKSAFKTHFQTLFQGGEADLVLQDEGVEIMAKPPGKQMRSMQLLSGGEKTLTALALLFACFDVRPSPFCILDEVDAPLDESNVERFGNLLKHFCNRTQFLVITHNKKTMQIAESLIGVSMPEKGVSQIIALDFRRRETPQQAVLISNI